MKFLGFDISINRSKPAPAEPAKRSNPKSGFGASVWTHDSGVENSVTVIGYDGEITMGGVGPIKAYSMRNEALRLRGRQLYIESPLAQAIIDKRAAWVVGDGLKIQCQPKAEVLKHYGVELDKEEFNKKVEAFFSAYAQSTEADYSGNRTLHKLLEEAQKEREIGGDILVILRVVNGLVKVQHINPSRISNPLDVAIKENKEGTGYDYYVRTGNRVRKGVEIDDTGRAVAFWVQTGASGDRVRIAAYGSRTGLQYAYLVKGKTVGVDDPRGVGILSSSIELNAKLNDYIDATVTTLKERAKYQMFFEHDKESTQQDPMEGMRVKASIGMGEDPEAVGIASTNTGTLKVNKVAVSENAMVMDLPKGVTAKALESKTENMFPGFTAFMMQVQTAAAGMPLSMVMSKYEGSFSSARMDSKDGEFHIKLARTDLATQYLMPIYMLQLYGWALQGIIDAPAYIKAVESKNALLVGAFLACRWVGPNVPDIDPLKTANYLRKMLGDDLANVPIMTLEAAAEHAGQGDFDSIIEQVGHEKEKAIEEGISPVIQKGATSAMPNDATTTEEREVEDTGSGN